MMNCFPCFSSQKSRKSPSKNENSDNNHNNNNNDVDHNEFRPPVAAAATTTTTTTKQHDEIEEAPPVKTFNFRELASATKNFRQECLIREGGFGRVYRGTLQSTGQLVAVKQLDKHGLHGTKEFQAEVLALSKLQHPNLVKLIGYCADGDQRLLVFEFISGGSLQDHLHELNPSQKPMDWITRMKIAYGAAQGLDYLHDKVNPPVLYKDLKASSILLDEKFQPKLCDFGLKTVDPGTADSLFFSSRVMDTYGYSAPEYTRGDELTVKSDVYSFGVVLLELITGRRAIDTTKPNDEQNLVAWAQPIFRDPKRYPDMADPLLRKNFSERGLNQAVAITSMCVQEEATARPLISDVMVALSFLSMSTEDGIPTAVPILSFRDKSMSIALSRHDSSSVTPSSAIPVTKQDQEDKSSASSSSSSSDSEDSDEEKKRKTSKVMSKKKEEEEESEMESESESESESEKDQAEESSQVEKSRNSSSSSESETEIRRSIDNGNDDNAQSLKIKYSYSSEEEEEEQDEEEEEEEQDEEEEERLSSKSSHEYTEENTFSLSLTDRMNDEHEEEEEEEEEDEIQLEKIKSSKSEAESVYSDHESEEEE